MKLVFDYSRDSIVRLSAETHWCRSLKIETGELPAEQINQVLLASLKIFTIGNCMRKSQEIEMFLGLYARYLDGDFENMPVTMLVHEFSEISKCFDFSKALFKFTLSKAGRNIAGAAFLSARNKGLPLNLHSSLHQSDNYQLDSCLLSLLFKNSQSVIEQRALILILENFNHQNNLITDLEDINLLYSQSQKNVYLAMQYNINSLKSMLTRLINDSEIASLKNEKIEDAFEQSYVESIGAIFQQIISLLNISQPKEHLLFAQSIARNLGYHRLVLKFFLNYNLPWLEAKAKRITVVALWKPTYKSLVLSLFSFALKNIKNQLLIYPNISSIVYNFGNSI